MSLARDLADLASEANGISNSIVANSSSITSLSIAGESVSPVQSFRNKIINGNFDFWQRGTSTSSTGYLADQWFNAYNLATHTTSRQSFTVGQTDVPGEPTYYHRSVVTTASNAAEYGLVGPIIESSRTLAGQTATLSFWAKADSSKNIAIEFYRIYGSGGSPSTPDTMAVETVALTSSWQKFEVTVDIPSISGKTLGTTHDGCISPSFWFTGGSDYNARTNSLGNQSGTFDIAQVQLEAGPRATPFEQRPLGLEWMLCQRYYEILFYQILNVAYPQSGLTYYQTSNFLVHKRVLPTITYGNHGTAGFAGTRATTHYWSGGVIWQDVATTTGATVAYSYCYIIADASI